ncbi:hypothetical protein Tco_0406672, partial [Tanacetum coccineum]
PKASNSSPLGSPTATINMSRGMYNVDVAATFGVLLSTVGDLDVLKRILKLAENTNVDAIPCKVSHVDDLTIVDALVAENLNVDESLIVQSVSIQNKP